MVYEGTALDSSLRRCAVKMFFKFVKCEYVELELSFSKLLGSLSTVPKLVDCLFDAGRFFLVR